MGKTELTPENISLLIDRVLETKDPAVVGLKRILRKRQEECSDYPLRGVVLEEFATSAIKSKKLSDEEKQILELEKKVADLKAALNRQRKAAAEAVQAAFTKGRTEGFEAGRSEGAAETARTYEKRIDLLQRRIGDILEKIEESKRSIFANSEHLLLKLCCAMVKKIIDHEVTVNHEIVLSTLKRALSYIGHHEKMVVRVAPGDLETAAQRKDFWLPAAQRLKDISIEADSRIEPGGCIVESNCGVVDARLGVQFDELAGLIEKTWKEVTEAESTGTSPDDAMDESSPLQEHNHDLPSGKSGEERRGNR